MTAAISEILPRLQSILDAIYNIDIDVPHKQFALKKHWIPDATEPITTMLISSIGPPTTEHPKHVIASLTNSATTQVVQPYAGKALQQDKL
ncbi:unnamed protein product [Camellia sinensis]